MSDSVDIVCLTGSILALKILTGIKTRVFFK